MYEIFSDMRSYLGTHQEDVHKVSCFVKFFVFFNSRFVNITASKPRLYIAGLPVCQLTLNY